MRRPRLLQRLAAHPRARIVVLEGPAGSGKSMLAYDALVELGAPFAWYSLDPTDEDPRVFVAYLLEALTMVAPDVSRRAVAVLQTVESDDVGPVMAALFNAASRYGGPLRLVLDDVHHAARLPRLSPWLRCLIRQAPDALQVWLLTRRPLRLGLPRHEAQGEVLRLDSQALQFDLAETRALVQGWNWPPHPELASTLLEVTGGWITGMHLVQRQLGQKVTAEGLLQRLSQASAAASSLFEYLADQVLRELPPRLRHFLLSTSLLDQFDEAAAEAVSGDDRAARLLLEVEGRGLFLLREQRTWRYHHWFADFLRRTLLLQEGRRKVRRRHAQLARYFAPMDPVRAIHHAVQGAAWDHAAGLLAAHGERLLSAGWTSRVAAWMSSLPSAVQDSSRELILLNGMLAELQGE
ncbi:MAG TPA: hypothetical protein VGO93_14740, partial [Candidatus Xenobia bacterium]